MAGRIAAETVLSYDVFMAQTLTSKTRVEDVYARIRADILSGQLQTGQRLRLAALCKDHAVSLSIIREALTRLAAEKLVRAKPQQGFAVIGLSTEELRDMTFARIAVESVALRRSIERGDIEWQGRLLAAHHRLACQFASKRDPLFASNSDPSG
jgi:DNA-binding GntR family transcriptional regulator